MIALAFRLNQPAIQAANYLAMPFQVALILPLVRLGSKLLPLGNHTHGNLALLSQSPTHLFAQSRHLVMQVGGMAGQALVAWLLLAIPVVVLLTPTLTVLLRRVPALAASECRKLKRFDPGFAPSAPFLGTRGGLCSQWLPWLPVDEPTPAVDRLKACIGSKKPGRALCYSGKLRMGLAETPVAHRRRTGCMAGDLKPLGPCLIDPMYVGRVWGYHDPRPWYDRQASTESGSREPIGEVWLTGDACRIAPGAQAGKRRIAVKGNSCQRNAAR